YMAPASTSTQALICAINSDRISAGKPPLRVIIHEFSRLHDGTVAEFISAAGAAPDAAEVVHIQNAGGQHYEALLPCHSQQKLAPPVTESGLNLTAEQKLAINQCTAKNFCQLLSCITLLPIVVIPASAAEKKPLNVYEAGTGRKTDQQLNQIPDAIVISKQQQNALLVINQSGNQQMHVLLASADPVTILETIPRKLYLFTDSAAIHATFTHTPEQLAQLGAEKYHQLKSFISRSEQTGIVNQLQETEKFFNTTPAGITLIKNGFFRSLLRDIEFTLLPANQQKKIQLAMLVRPGSTVEKTLTITEPALIHLIVGNISCPPPWAFEKMTDIVIQDTQYGDAFASYLYILARNLPKNKTLEFNAAFKKIMAAYHDNRSSFYDITKKIVEKVYMELALTPLMSESTQTRLKYYASLFINASRIYTQDMKYQYAVMEGFWPLLASSWRGFRENYPAMRKTLSFNLENMDVKYRNLYSIEDRVVSVLLSAAFRQPLTWTETIAEQFKLILSNSGSDGNMPLATVYFIAFAHERISAQYSAQMFRELFNSNVKKAKKNHALVMQCLIEVYPPDQIADIYKAKTEDVVATYLSYWQRLQHLKHIDIGDRQCVVIYPHHAAIDDSANWQDHLRDHQRNPVVLTAAGARRLQEKLTLTDHYIYTNSDADRLFSAILLSASSQPGQERKRIVDDITDANFTTEENLTQNKNSNLNSRLQVMVKNALATIRSEETTEKTDQDKRCEQLIDLTLSIRMGQFIQEKGRVSAELVSNIVDNLSSITVAATIAPHLDALRHGVQQKTLSEDLYITLISKVMAQSFIKNPDSHTAIIIRTIFLKSALNTVTQRDKLFLALAELPTNLTSTQAGYHAFINLAIKEMELPLESRQASAASNATAALSSDERLAFSIFLTSSQVSWGIIPQAYTAVYSDKAGSYTQHGAVKINTEWLINPQRFLQAPPAVQHQMLKFFPEVLQQDPTSFINQCLNAISESLLSATSVSTVANLENSLNYLCDFLPKQRPAAISAMIDAIFQAARQLTEKKGIRGLSSALKNSLKALPEVVRTTDSAKYHALPADYFELIKADTVQQFFIPAVNQETPSNRTSNTSANSTSESEGRTSSNTPLAITSDVKPKKTITAPTFYVGNNWAELNATADQSQALQQALALMLSDSRSHELRLHKYKHAGIWSIDIKPRDIQDITASQQGRSNCRCIMLQGSNNRFILLKVGTHAQTSAEAKNYLKVSKKRVDAMIDNPGTQYQKLHLNPATGQLEMDEHDAATGNA
ncbi:hypothetical protein, partial [Pantoea sp. B65]|uniref:hypothetical protein n=1 Tax=Pantoea sp. B65 TaxID=2813359 RepID=UPI0039B38AF7